MKGPGRERDSSVSLQFQIAASLFQSGSTLTETKIGCANKLCREQGRLALSPPLLPLPLSPAPLPSQFRFKPAPAIYPANIFQLFFHSASSLLFSNHRPTSIVPFIRGKRGTLALFPIVPPAFRFRPPPSSNLQGKLAAKHFQLSVDF